MSVSLILLEILSPSVLGDATIAGFDGQISIESFSWSVRMTKKKGDTKSPNALEPQTLNIKKQFDRSTTVLSEMMKKDKPFNATLRFVDPSTRPKGGQGKFDSIVEIELVGCHIESISLDGDDSGKSVTLGENLVLSFEKSITFSYRSFNAINQSRANAKTAIVKVT